MGLLLFFLLTVTVAGVNFTGLGPSDVLHVDDRFCMKSHPSECVYLEYNDDGECTVLVSSLREIYASVRVPSRDKCALQFVFFNLGVVWTIGGWRRETHLRTYPSAVIIDWHPCGGWVYREQIQLVAVYRNATVVVSA